MSLWTDRYMCKTCNSEINIQQGVVGTTSMGPSDSQLFCPNPSCNAPGYASFEFLHRVDFNNPEDRDFTIRNNHTGNGD